MRHGIEAVGVTPIGKVAVFVDGSNLLYAGRALNVKWDYIKLLQYLTDGRMLLRAFFYTGVKEDDDESANFRTWLSREAGYCVRTKPVKTFRDVDGNLHEKADLDMELAMDMLGLCHAYDVAILVSGDGDFAPLVYEVGRHGVRVEVASVQCAHPFYTAGELIDAADKFIDLGSSEVKPHVIKSG